jgi:hypothetical protein
VQDHEKPPACQASTTAMVRKRVQRDSRSPPGTRTGDRLRQPSTKYSKVSACEVRTHHLHADSEATGKPIPDGRRLSEPSVSKQRQRYPTSGTTPLA